MSTAEAAGPGVPAVDRDSADYQAGRGAGTEWARDYATHDELRDLVDNFQPGRSVRFGADHSVSSYLSGTGHASAAGVSHDDTPFWRGFATGAQEVLDELCTPG